VQKKEQEIQALQNEVAECDFQIQDIDQTIKALDSKLDFKQERITELEINCLKLSGDLQKYFFPSTFLSITRNTRMKKMRTVKEINEFIKVCAPLFFNMFVDLLSSIS
jgi:chromosome segregation ATPase